MLAEVEAEIYTQEEHKMNRIKTGLIALAAAATMAACGGGANEGTLYTSTPGEVQEATIEVPEKAYNSPKDLGQDVGRMPCFHGTPETDITGGTYVTCGNSEESIRLSVYKDADEAHAAARYYVDVNALGRSAFAANNYVIVTANEALTRELVAQLSE